LGRRRRRLFLILPAEVFEIAAGHFAGGLWDALVLNRLRRVLGGLLDLAGEVDAGLLLERLARRVAVKHLLALRVELRRLAGVEGVGRALLAVGASAGALAAVVLAEIVRRCERVVLRVGSIALAAVRTAECVFRLLQSGELVAEIVEFLLVEFHVAD